VSVEQFAYSEALMALPDQTAFYAVTMRPFDALSALELNPGVAFAMIDRTLGGSGETAAPARALTEIEQNVVDSVVRVLLEHLTETWKTVTDRLLHVLTSCGDRMAALTTSVSLLTDTTEACFLTLSRQLELVQTNGAAKRQRRTSTARSYASRTAPAPAIAVRRLTWRAGRDGTARAARRGRARHSPARRTRARLRLTRSTAGRGIHT
jgi:hypothetical protein